MRLPTKRALVGFIDALLLLALFGIAPFAWILRDGLGPDSVHSSGLDALRKAFLTFHAGPTILLLGGLHLLVSHAIRKQAQKGGRGSSVFLVLGTLLLLTAISVVFISLIFD